MSSRWQFVEEVFEIKQIAESSEIIKILVGPHTLISECLFIAKHVCCVYLHWRVSRYAPFDPAILVNNHNLCCQSYNLNTFYSFDQEIHRTVTNNHQPIELLINYDDLDQLA